MDRAPGLSAQEPSIEKVDVPSGISFSEYGECRLPAGARPRGNGPEQHEQVLGCTVDEAFWLLSSREPRTRGASRGPHPNAEERPGTMKGQEAEEIPDGTARERGPGQRKAPQT